MIKLKENAVKTMAAVLADSGGAQKNSGSIANPSETDYLNRKLREAFGISANPKNTPLPQWKSTALSSKIPGVNFSNTGNQPSTVSGSVPKTKQSNVAPAPIVSKTPPQTNTTTKTTPIQPTPQNDNAQNKKNEAPPQTEEEKQRIEEQKKDEEEKKRRIEEQKKDEEEKKRIQEKQKLEESRKKAEELKKAEEKWKLQEEAKAEQEKERRQRERAAAEERIKKEKLLIQAEKEKEREEKRRQLEVLEIERKKTAIKKLEQMKQEAEKPVPETEKKTPSANNDASNPQSENLSVCLQTLAEKLRAKKTALERQISGLPALKSPLEQKKLALEEKISLIKNSELRAAEIREKEIEDKEAEEKTKTGQKLSADEEKYFNKKLWSLEEQRKESEKIRWGIEDQINALAEETQKINFELEKKNSEMEAVKQKAKEISAQERLVLFAVEKGKLEDGMLEDINRKNQLMPLLQAVSGKKNAAETSLKTLSEKQTSTETEINAIELKEKQTTDPKEKRAIEQRRWVMNDTLKSIIQSKWKDEEKLNKINSETQLLQNKINAIEAKIADSQNRISSGENALEKDGMKVRKIRDAIAALFEENGIKVNSGILKDITQTDNQTATQTQAANPVAQTQPQPPLAAANDPGKPAATAEKKEAAGKPAAANKPQETAAKPAVQTATQTQAAESGKNKAIEESGKNGIGWNPETKLDDIVATAKKIPPESLPANPAESLSKTASLYREHIESSPATNFRTFPKNDAGRNQPSGQTNIPQLPSRPKADSKPGAETEPEKPDSIGLENRWSQIKKATAAPIINPAATAAPKTLPEAPVISTRLEPKPSGKNKLLPRVLVILAAIGILAAILIVILTKNNSPAEKNQNTNNPVTIKNSKTPNENDPENPDETKKEANQSPLATISTIPVLTEDLASVPNLISPSLQTPLGSNGYYRVTVQNKKNNTRVGLRQFFDIYKIEAPSLLYSAVNDDFTLFIYSNNGRNRIGLVAAITNAKTLSTAIEGWEGSMVQDTDNLFKLLGRKTQTQADKIKFSSGSGSGGAPYRFAEFSPAGDNFSIAYAIYKDKYFIFTTSKDSLAKIFDQLPK